MAFVNTVSDLYKLTPTQKKNIPKRYTGLKRKIVGWHLGEARLRNKTWHVCKTCHIEYTEGTGKKIKGYCPDCIKAGKYE